MKDYLSATIMLISIALGIGFYNNMAHSVESEQPQLKAPWRGTPWRSTVKVTQGNHGSTSHYDHGIWDNTYAMDISLPVGSDVLASADGVITWYDPDKGGRGGVELAIDHTSPAGDTVTTVYLHLSEVIKKSGTVKQGEVIARSGDTGKGVTGPHLHFHIWSRKGSRDSHTIPIQRLVMKQVGVDDSFREYDARNGDLDQNKIAGRYFESNNFPPSSARSARFTTGNNIRTTESLRIRKYPELKCDIVTTLPKESIGQICDDENNGVFIDGYYWWYVQFGVYNGWCVENWLEGIEDDREKDESDVLSLVFTKKGLSLGIVELLREAVMVGDKAHLGRPISLHSEQVVVVSLGDLQHSGRVLNPKKLRDRELAEILNLDRSPNVRYDLEQLEVAETVTQGPKEVNERSGRSIIVPGAVLKPGTYISFHGPYSDVAVDEAKQLIAVSIQGEFYFASEVEVAEDHSQATSSKKVSEEVGILFTKATLKKGTYTSFNGSDAAFLFDKERPVAVLIGREKECDLYIATTAEEYYGDIRANGMPKSLLNVEPGASYTAFVAPESAVTIDQDGRPVRILKQETKSHRANRAKTLSSTSRQLGGDTEQIESHIQEPAMEGPESITGKDGVAMVLIPAGEFQMGSKFAREKPIHTVYLNAFYMDAYEVTNAQYAKFLNLAEPQPIRYAIDINSEVCLIERTAGGLLFGMGLEFQDDLDDRDISERLRQQFENNNTPISYDVDIQVEEEHNRWMVDDKDRNIRYIIKREDDDLNAYEEVYRPKAGYENHPVIMVTLSGAAVYAQFYGKRLPTEAEWEKAARGGLVGKMYPWGNKMDYTKANCDYLPPGESISKSRARSSETHGTDVLKYLKPIGSFAPNGYGLYDMAGNVQEWCADHYNSFYYQDSPKENPKGPSSGPRVVRGGSWRSNSFCLRVAYRRGGIVGYSDNETGFRCVQDVRP